MHTAYPCIDVSDVKYYSNIVINDFFSVFPKFTEYVEKVVGRCEMRESKYAKSSENHNNEII